MLKYRPLSPHLTIYDIQPSSLFSIWHRITGVSNFLFLFSNLLIFKLFIWGMTMAFFTQITYAVLKCLIGLLYISLLYHVLNGYRHLMWDLNIFLTNKSVNQSAFLLLSILFLFFIFNLNFIF